MKYARVIDQTSSTTALFSAVDITITRQQKHDWSGRANDVRHPKRTVASGKDEEHLQVLIDEVEVGRDGGEAGGGAHLAAKDGSKGGDSGESAFSGHEGSARVSVAGGSATLGVDADDPAPVHATIVFLGNLQDVN